MTKKILVIDDDEATLKLLKPFLAGKGWQVETALDGVEGMEKTRSWKPDLIVLDVVMPRMDGYGFVRELKKDLQLRRIPVVVLTAREMMRDVFVQEGIKDYVVKPYDPEELAKVISKYF
jgi:CheY-like chemotaxis protein